MLPESRTWGWPVITAGCRHDLHAQYRDLKGDALAAGKYALTLLEKASE
jgi:hypothetical protein